MVHGEVQCLGDERISILSQNERGEVEKEETINGLDNGVKIEDFDAASNKVVEVGRYALLI